MNGNSKQIDNTCLKQETAAATARILRSRGYG